MVQPRLLVVLAVWLAVIKPSSQDVPEKHHVYRLYEELFENRSYHKEVRPPQRREHFDRNQGPMGGPIIIYIIFHLLSMLEVDEESQTMETYSQLYTQWFDDWNLVWKSDDFGGIVEIEVPQEIVWKPDLVVHNSADPHVQPGYKQLPVQVVLSGQVIWSPSLVSRTQCDIDVTFYPFDTQKCEIIISTEVSTNSVMQLWGSRIDLSGYTEDGSWKLIEAVTTRVEQREGQSDDDFLRQKPTLILTLLLERRSTFYVVSIIAPVVCLSLTASIVFALPADCGEKMGTGITVLLAFDLYLIIIADFLPDTSLHTSILAVYLTVLLGITTFSVIITALTLRLHHSEGPVGPKTRAVVRFVQRITCRSRDGNLAQKKEREIPPPDYEPTDDDNGAGMTWAQVADTFDRFLFFFFTTTSITFTVVCVTGMVVFAHKPSMPEQDEYK